VPTNFSGLVFATYLVRPAYFYFYRAMHHSAKRGIEIACRPSAYVCPSVTLLDQDHIGGNIGN